MLNSQPKPEPRQRVKRRKKRHARKVVKSVRAQCVDRDGYCRYPLELGGKDVFAILAIKIFECSGPSEWAHLGEQKRFKTRGKPPEVRHTTSGSLILCKKHHEDYDRGRLIIHGDDANKPLQFEAKQR